MSIFYLGFRFLIITQDLRISGTSQGIIERSFLSKLRKVYPEAIIDVLYLCTHNQEDQLEILPVNSIVRKKINSKIPLYVKSFINPLLPGTSVSKGEDLDPKTSCFIIKKNQLLISLSAIDFSFIMEENISEIFGLLHKYKIKVSLIQNTAISFSVCIEDKFGNFNELKTILSKKFKVSYNENVSLYTIRHFTKEASEMVEKDKEVLLKQISRETLQIVTKE